MIHCKHPLPSAAGLTTHHQLVLLKKERNEFAKSRHEWIRAAFLLAFHKDDTKFRELVEDELCDLCKENYAKHNV